jgi:hypothetical protein
LKKEIEEMRKELDGAFGVSKIVTMENMKTDLVRER